MYSASVDYRVIVVCHFLVQLIGALLAMNTFPDVELQFSSFSAQLASSCVYTSAEKKYQI